MTEKIIEGKPGFPSAWQGDDPPQGAKNGDVWKKGDRVYKLRGGKWVEQPSFAPKTPSAEPPMSMREPVTHEQYNELNERWNKLLAGEDVQWDAADEWMLVEGRANEYAKLYPSLSSSDLTSLVKAERQKERITHYMNMSGATAEEAAKALGYDLPPGEGTTDEDLLAQYLASQGGGGGATGMTAEEKQLQAASMLLSLLGEKGSREQASIQELADIYDKWTETLKRAVTPELKEMIASRTFTEPEKLQTQRVDYTELAEQAKKLPQMEEDIPQIQQILAQILPGWQVGGAVGGLSADPNWAYQQVYGAPGAGDVYAGPGGADVLVGEDWYIDEYGQAQLGRPQLQQELFGQMGVAAPGLLGQPYEEFGPAYEELLAGGGGYPTLEAQNQEANRALTQEIEGIRAEADRDVAEIQRQADNEVAQIMADADKAAARYHAQGMAAQARATENAARAQAQATIQSAQIAAQNRLQVAQLQEQGAKERLGAQLGMQWAETSQQMAMNPRDYLALAFRQAGGGIPPALEQYLQPQGGAVPNMAGAPQGIQSILAEYLGMAA